jgi:homogentisate 1,2-dioxygenase
MAQAVQHDTKDRSKVRKAETKAPGHEASVEYQPGFGNHFVSEVVAGALPVGRNSPQRPPLTFCGQCAPGHRADTQAGGATPLRAAAKALDARPVVRQLGEIQAGA